mgnify:CR=1 FL=1
MVSNSESAHSEWFKMIECKDCNGYEWEVSSWEEVFDAPLPPIDEYLKEAEKVNESLDKLEEKLG